MLSDLEQLFHEEEEDDFTSGLCEVISADEVPNFYLPPSVVSEIYSILQTIHNVFAKFGIQYWLVSGSLLGHVRHGGIIPWDDDADICCFQKDKDLILSEKFKSELKLYDTFVDEAVFCNMVDPSLLKVYRSKIPITKKVNSSGFSPFPFCDILLVSESEDKNMIQYCSRNHIANSMYHAEVFPLKEVKFGPILVNVPCSPEPILDREYGVSWRTKGVIQRLDHATKDDSYEGLTKVFKVEPFLNCSAKFS